MKEKKAHKTIKRKILTWIQIKTVSIVFFFLGRGFQILPKIEPEIEKEIKQWEDSFAIHLKTENAKPSLWLQKEKGNMQRKKKKTMDKEQLADIEITFKSIDHAFFMMIGKEGVANAYARHRFTLKGDITKAISFVRCVDIIEAYLFPKLITKHILKQIPKRKQAIIFVYLRLLIGV